jgi:hypothetical protein
MKKRWRKEKNELIHEYTLMERLEVVKLKQKSREIKVGWRTVEGLKLMVGFIKFFVEICRILDFAGSISTIQVFLFSSSDCFCLIKSLSCQPGLVIFLLTLFQSNFHVSLSNQSNIQSKGSKSPPTSPNY